MTPQEGLISALTDERLLKLEKILLTSLLLHEGQDTTSKSLEEKQSSSNLAPHSLQINSYIGIRSLFPPHTPALARPGGFEPPASGFEAQRSIRLSYGRPLDPGGGFEPPFWEPKSHVLPLDDPGVSIA